MPSGQGWKGLTRLWLNTGLGVPETTTVSVGLISS